MIWVAWRQQRLQIAVTVGLAALTAAVMIAFRLHAASYLAGNGLARCWESADGCTGPVMSAFTETYAGYLVVSRLVLLALPPLLGAFVGAPMFAREIEQGTHVFGLTQSVGRGRWWTTKVLVGATPVVAVMTAVGLLNSWARAPFESTLATRLATPHFETEALALGGYTLLAVALGIATGLLARNTVAAMAATLIVYIVIVVVLGSGFRAGYVDPEYAIGPLGSPGSTSLVPPGGWQVEWGYLDASGQPVDFSVGSCRSDGTPVTEWAEVESCLHTAGVTASAAWFHPGQRFWTIQAIEAGIVTLISALLLALSGWAVRRLA